MIHTMSSDEALAALAVLSGGSVIDLAGLSILPGVIDLGDGDQGDARLLNLVAADVVSANLLARDLNLDRGPGGTTWSGWVRGPRGSSVPIQCRITVQMPPELAAVLGTARQGGQ
jgi:hypothetical protein